MANIPMKYITDKDGNKVLPISHVSAVRDDEGNNIGTLLGNEADLRVSGDSALHNEINAEKTRATGAETTLNSSILAERNRALAAEEQLREAYEALSDTDIQIIQPTDTWPVADPQQYIIYRVIDRVNTPPTYYQDYMYNGTTLVLMAQYNNAIDGVPTPGSHNLVESGGVAASIVYDISAANSGAQYADLAAALGTNGQNVPESIRKGGMSIKYVQSSDNKYVQFRYIGTSTANNDFTNIGNWKQEVYDNLIKLQGMGSVSAGTTGVTAVGQYFYNTNQKKIFQCIHFPFTTMSDNFVEIKYHDGAIYTYKDYLYIWNGTDLVLINPVYGLIKLSGFVETQASIAVGDYYYNTIAKQIRLKTGEGSGGAYYEVIPFVDGAIYTYNGYLYIWNGSDLIKADKNTLDYIDSIIGIPSINLCNELIFDYSGGVYCSETPTGQVEFGDLYTGSIVANVLRATSAYNSIQEGDILLLALLSRPTGQAGICFYNSNKEPIKGIYLNAENAYNYQYIVAPENAAYFRMTKFVDGVVSEPFVIYKLSPYEELKYKFENKSFESVWEAIDVITPKNSNQSYLDSIESERDVTAMSFSFITDSHYNSTNKAKTMQVISDMVTLADYGCVDMGVHLGDVHDGRNITMAVMKKELTDIARQFYKQKAFCTMLKGNHDDGTWITTTSTGIIKSGVWRNRCMSDYGKMDDYKFNEANPFKNYFYKDFDKYKIRVVCLDTLDVPHFLVDEELKYKKTDYGMQEQQLQWLAQKALIIDKPDVSDWAVVFLTHVPLKSNGGDSMGLKNYDVFQMIVNGFINGTSGTATSVLEDFEANISFDFTTQGQGEVICNFHGHVHSDTYDNSGSFPLIGFLNTANANAYFDIATINRTSKQIKTMRYNRTGYDRAWNY